MPPKMEWYVAKPARKQKQKDSQAEKFFLSDAGKNRAEDLVREGLQNSMDAPASNSKQVRVRICFGSIEAAEAARYADGLQLHLSALPELKVIGQRCGYLMFEDFGTTGLTGDEKQERRYAEDEKNAFHTFFRAEGQTDKTHGELGSHGIGKIAFMAASQAHVVLGLTHRVDDHRDLVFGTAVLRSHRVEQIDYECDAWYGLIGEEAVLPSDDPSTLDQFRKDFGLSRKGGEAGFSIVVPWLDEDAESGITADQVINAVLRGHAYPIFMGSLVVEITDCAGHTTVIDAESFLDVLASRMEDGLKSELRPMAQLAKWSVAAPSTIEVGEPGEKSPKWTEVKMAPEQLARIRVRFENGDALAFRVSMTIRPQKSKEAPARSFFDVFLKREDTSSWSGPTVHYLRKQLLISGMSKSQAGIRALVLANDEVLAAFLRAAENVAHTKWDDKAVKKDYIYAPATLSFVVNSVKEIARLLAGDPNEKDKRIWADDLSLPAGPERGNGKAGPKKKPEGGVETVEGLVVEPEPKRPYQIRVIDGGFSVVPSGKPFPILPTQLELYLAYHVRGHNPLSHWEKDDFDFTERKSKGIKFVNTGCSIIKREKNQLVLRISKANFDFRVTGFDTNRELFCKPRLSANGESESAEPTELMANEN